MPILLLIISFVMIYENYLLYQRDAFKRKLIKKYYDSFKIGIINFGISAKEAANSIRELQEAMNKLGKKDV